MINFKRATIERMMFHHYSQDETQAIISDVEYAFENISELGPSAESLLLEIFLKPFAYLGSTYEFTHQVDLEMNVLNTLISKYQRKDITFKNLSQDVYRHLRDVSKHPNIKNGDVFVIEFDAISIEGAMVDGLGVFKVENKQSFLDTSSLEGGVNVKKGIGTGKLDKGCLILNTESRSTVLHIDSNRAETEYWKNEFLKIQPRHDNVTATNDVIKMTRTFIKEELPEEQKVSKTDQIDLLNRSAQYFKEAEVFNVDDYEKSVLKEEGMIANFQNFQQKSEPVEDGFELSDQAVKQQAKFFKSVLKLDKNFSLYVHGNRNMIEKGVDDNGRKFYKLYYEEER
jgi:hypothetical protein